MPLENGGAEGEQQQFNTKPVLVRARIPEWGSVHELVARLDLVGSGFERTVVRSCLTIPFHHPCRACLWVCMLSFCGYSLVSIAPAGCSCLPLRSCFEAACDTK